LFFALTSGRDKKKSTHHSLSVSKLRSGKRSAAEFAPTTGPTRTATRSPVGHKTCQLDCVCDKRSSMKWGQEGSTHHETRLTPLHSPRTHQRRPLRQTSRSNRDHALRVSLFRRPTFCGTRRAGTCAEKRKTVGQFPATCNKAKRTFPTRCACVHGDGAHTAPACTGMMAPPRRARGHVFWDRPWEERGLTRRGALLRSRCQPERHRGVVQGFSQSCTPSPGRNRGAVFSAACHTEGEDVLFSPSLGSDRSLLCARARECMRGGGRAKRTLLVCGLRQHRLHQARQACGRICLQKPHRPV
jgi:hypothetical protein